MSDELSRSAEPALLFLPLLEAVETHVSQGFTGALRIVLPGEEVRIFIRDGEPRFCTGSAGHHSFGAWLIRSGTIGAVDLKAASERAQTSKVRLEDLLVSEGRLSAEKLRAAQNAMSHFTFADVAVRSDLEIHVQPLDPPRIVDAFRLDPIRALLDFAVRFDRSEIPPSLLGALVRLGPRLEDRRPAFERVFGALFATLAGRLASGGFVLGEGGPEAARLALALVRTGAAVVAPSVRAESAAATRPAPLSMPVVGIPAGLLPTPGFPEASLSRLADALTDAGLMAPPVRSSPSGRSASVGARPPEGRVERIGAPPPTTVVFGNRNVRSAVAPLQSATELPPLESEPGPVVGGTPGHAPDLSLQQALERAVRAAADSESELDGDAFAVEVDPRTGDTLARRPPEVARTPSSGSRLSPTPPLVARPPLSATPPLASTPPLANTHLTAGTTPLGNRPSATFTRPAAPASKPPVEQARASAATSRSIGGPDAPRAPEGSEAAEIAALRRSLATVDPLTALGLGPGAPLSAIREAYVTRRARFDGALFAGRPVPPSVLADIDAIAAALDRLFGQLTARDSRVAIEASIGGLSALEISNYFGADALYRDGRKAHASRDFRAAHAAFLKAQQRWPREPDYPAWGAQAFWDLHIAEGTWNDATRAAVEKLLRDALSLTIEGKPVTALEGRPRLQHEQARVLLARLLLERGLAPEALDLYEAVLEQNPGHTEARSAVQELAAYAVQPGKASPAGILGGFAARLVQGIRGDGRRE